MRNASLARYNPVLAGADAGHYDLPEDVKAARRVLARVDVAATARRLPKVVQQHAAFAQAILDSSGDEWPDPAQLLAVDAERRAYDAWLLAVRDARDIAERSLVEALTGDPDRLVVDYLQPAHAEAVAAAKKRRTDSAAGRW